MSIPKIKEIKAGDEFELLVLFDNNKRKKYNCRSLLILPQFKELENRIFFKNVKVDPGGYGISWNADVDLSECELWTKGEEIE